MIALDYTARIPVAALIAAGVSDVCRYLCYSPAGDWKVIRKPEYDELIAGGIGVTLNWELAANDWAHGGTVGGQHGAEAVRQAKALGYPAGCTIIGSADFNMDHATWDDVGRAYATSFAAAVRSGGYRPGVYGPWDVLQWVHDAGLMDMFWQAGMSTAWSAGRNGAAWPGAQIRQRRHLSVAGQDTDVSDIRTPDWGQARQRGAAPQGTTEGAPTMMIGTIVGDKTGSVYVTWDGRTRQHLEGAQADTLAPLAAAGYRGVQFPSEADLTAVMGPVGEPELAAVRAGLAALAARPAAEVTVTADLMQALGVQLLTNLAPILEEIAERAAENALRKVLGAVDGAVPPTT